MYSEQEIEKLFLFASLTLHFSVRATRAAKLTEIDPERFDALTIAAACHLNALSSVCSALADSMGMADYAGRHEDSGTLMTEPDLPGLEGDLQKYLK